MKKIFLILGVVFGCNLVASAQESNQSIQNVPSWSYALEKAKKENKLLFVDCYFTGCLPCAQMDKEVFPNTQVIKAFTDDYVAIKVDVFKEKLGDTLVRKFALGGFPTFLILDAKGNLISMFSGYKDVGLLINELKEAKEKARSKNSLSGFATNLAIDYPQFYLDYYNREERKSDPVAANNWIKKQKNWKAEPVALAIIKTRKLDAEMEDYFLKNYHQYREQYGQSLVREKLVSILSSQIKEAVGAQKNDVAFDQFLSKNKAIYAGKDWAIVEHQLAYQYYGAIAKDTVAMLRFMSNHPLIYQNILGALYSTMLVKKQLNETTLPYLSSWVKKAVTEESAFDIIRTAASIHKLMNDEEAYQLFVNMAIKKAKKYDVPDEAFQRMLAKSK